VGHRGCVRASFLLYRELPGPLCPRHLGRSQFPKRPDRSLTLPLSCPLPPLPSCLSPQRIDPAPIEDRGWNLAVEAIWCLDFTPAKVVPEPEVARNHAPSTAFGNPAVDLLAETRGVDFVFLHHGAGKWPSFRALFQRPLAQPSRFFFFRSGVPTS